MPAAQVATYGGGSPRKSLAQWLYHCHVPRHVIADIGGWALTNRDAMDSYHTTEPRMTMEVKAALVCPQHVAGTHLPPGERTYAGSFSRLDPLHPCMLR
jgi:hypothetical protein